MMYIYLRNVLTLKHNGSLFVKCVGYLPIKRTIYTVSVIQLWIMVKNTIKNVLIFSA